MWKIVDVPTSDPEESTATVDALIIQRLRKL